MMYYAAICRKDDMHQRLARLADGVGIDVKCISLDSEQGQELMEHARIDLRRDYDIPTPVVMVGEEVIGFGTEGMLDMYEHWLEHPHHEWNTTDLTCSVCGYVGSHHDFHANKASARGYDYRCKACQHKRYINNKEDK